MELRLIILVGLTVIAVIAAALLQRRRPEPPSSPSYRTIAEIDRSEFAHRDVPVLVVMFGSQTCHTCPRVWEIIESIERPGVAIERIDVQTDPTRHRRYRIDGVPTTVIAAADGTVRRTLFGPVDRSTLVSLLDESG